MKTLSICLLALLLAHCVATAQSYAELVKEASAAYHAKEYQKSAALYRKAFDIEKKSAIDLYNAACSASMAGDVRGAFEFLHAAVENGWTNLYHLKKDPDLVVLHSYSTWSEILKTLQEKIDVIEANYDRPLQKQLLEIFEKDQEIRRQFIAALQQYGYQSKEADSLRKIMVVTDSINLAAIKSILDEKGWVGESKVGAQGNQTLFLVIQHSDLKTQQHYLPMMRDAVKQGNARASSLALLEDRVAIGEGRRQIYGSQIGRNERLNKHYILPLEDPDNVDKRRADVGLEPLADYVKRWGMEWNVEDYKKELPVIEQWASEIQY